MVADPARLPYALTLSLLVHALLLSLTFGGDGWLPGFVWPWQARRIEATDLHVVLVPAQRTAKPAVPTIAEPLPEASAEQPSAGALPSSVRSGTPTTPARTPPALVAQAEPRSESLSTPEPGARVDAVPDAAAT